MGVVAPVSPEGRNGRLKSHQYVNLLAKPVFATRLDVK
jgi:hypothetical protein